MSPPDDNHIERVPLILNTAPITLCLFSYSESTLRVEWYAVLGWRDYGLGVVPVTASTGVNDDIHHSRTTNVLYCLEQRLVGQAPVYLFPTVDDQFAFDDARAYATQLLSERKGA